MGNPYPAEIFDANALGRQVGSVTFTDPDNQPGGGSQPISSGEGSPVGSVTPSEVGALYIDTATPALWQAVGVTEDDWVQIGAVADLQAVLEAGNTATLDINVTTPGAIASQLLDAEGFGLEVSRTSISAHARTTIGFDVSDDFNTALSLGHDGSNNPTIGFLGHARVVRQNVPLTTPSAQDVIDALVALGLVEQSD